MKALGGSAERSKSRAGYDPQAGPQHETRVHVGRRSGTSSKVEVSAVGRHQVELGAHRSSELDHEIRRHDSAHRHGGSSSLKFVSSREAKPTRPGSEVGTQGHDDAHRLPASPS